MENKGYDPRLVEVEKEKDAALEATDAVYEDLIAQTQANYDKLIAAEQEYGAAQLASQQEKADLEAEQLQQEQADKQADYEKEQAAAYTDYQTQVNAYSPEAEKMADAGLSGSGYSESAKVSMFNAYQNRVAVARQGFDQAMRDYDMAIREARQLNSATLAKIAYETLKRQSDLALKAVTQYAQLQLKWADQHWDQEKYFRSWEADVRKQMQENPSYMGTESPNQVDKNNQFAQRF